MTKFKIEDGQEVKIEEGKEYRLRIRYEDIPKIHYNDKPMSWPATICLWFFIIVLLLGSILWPLSLASKMGATHQYPQWKNFP